MDTQKLTNYTLMGMFAFGSSTLIGLMVVGELSESLWFGVLNVPSTLVGVRLLEERVWYKDSHRLHRLNDKVTELEKLELQVYQSLESAHNLKEELEERTIYLNNECNYHLTKIQRISSHRHKLYQELETLQRSNQREQQTYERRLKEVAELEKRQAEINLQLSMKSAIAQTGETPHQIKELGHQLYLKQKQHQNLRQKFLALQKVKTKLEEDKLQLEEKVTDLQSREDQLKLTITNLQKKHLEMSTQVIKNHATLSQLANKITATEEHKTKITQDIRTLQQRKNSLLAEVKRHREKLDQIKASI
ncbi:MAG: hypothetical protein HC796_06755 [Synechococcaceae cyanobacterium RL_1_2]|nr:hypothetical protein [Synechococcaceae cyanobacterium RL_1_2]